MCCSLYRYISAWSWVLLICVYFCVRFGVESAFSRNMSRERVDAAAAAIPMHRANNTATYIYIIYICMYILNSIQIDTPRRLLWYYLYMYRYKILPDSVPAQSFITGLDIWYTHVHSGPLFRRWKMKTKITAERHIICGRRIFKRLCCILCVLAMEGGGRLNENI